MRTLSTMIALALVLVGCSSPVSVSTDYTKGTDFSKYQKYAWALPADGAVKSIADNRIETAVNAQLTKKGFTVVDSQADADAIVAHITKTQQQTQVYSGGYGWGWGGVDVSQYNEGTLIVAIADPTTQQMVWQGTATGAVDDQPSGSKIDEIVANMFSGYPPKK